MHQTNKPNIVIIIKMPNNFEDKLTDLVYIAHDAAI